MLSWGTLDHVYTIIMNAHLVWTKGGYHIQTGVCIYVREEHWAANWSHAHKSDTWWMFQHGQKSSNISWELLLLNCLKHYKRSPYICFPCLPGMDVLLLRLNSLHRSFVQEAWRYPFMILDKTNMHMKKVYVNLYLSRTRCGY